MSSSGQNSATNPPLPPNQAPPLPPRNNPIRSRELDEFEYKAAIENRDLATMVKLNSKNYRDWQSRMIYFLKSRKIFDVCTKKQDDDPSPIVNTMQQVAMQHLAASVDDTIYNSIFADPTDLTPFKVWSLLLEN
ncbi:hypothetical protein PSHT_07294 [Puccinia striiformis]|uniref:Retrotransposon Copia-like N-terminal domain-containing protein n=1 Tax=Puccinia striiformis TaxID=27350 RepID=A0A2S4VZD5_9BASI|nr:hypothetical protein PSHT_07294 [Puccinia striiformis]